MTYVKDGRFWPTEVDKNPRTDRFHVPQSSLLSDQYDPIERAIVITETEQLVQERLQAKFPLYRLAKWGKRIVALGKESSHEV